MATNVEDIPEEDDDFTAREYSASEFVQMLDDAPMPTDDELMNLLTGGMQFEEDEEWDEEEDSTNSQQPGSEASQDPEASSDLETVSQETTETKTEAIPEEEDGKKPLPPYDPETGEVLEVEEPDTAEVNEDHQEAEAPATESQLPASQKQSSTEPTQEVFGQQPQESSQDPSGTPGTQPTPDSLQSLLDQATSLLNKAEDLQQSIAVQSEQLAELTSTLESIKSLEDQNAAQIEASAKDVEKSTIGLKVMLRNTEKKFEESGKNIEAAEKKFNRQITDMTKNAKQSIGELANAARDHIQKLEQESMKRSQAYFQLNLPQKILNYMKWFGCIVIFVLAVAWILERVVG